MCLAAGWTSSCFSWYMIWFSLYPFLLAGIWLLFDFANDHKATSLIWKARKSLAHAKRVLDDLNQNQRGLINKVDPTYFSRTEEIFVL